MTASHMRALLRQLPQAKRSEVHMYRSFDPNLPKPAAGREDSIDLVDPVVTVVRANSKWRVDKSKRWRHISSIGPNSSCRTDFLLRLRHA